MIIAFLASLTLSALAMLGVLYALAKQPKEPVVMILPDFAAPLADISSKLDLLIAAASNPAINPQDIGDTLAAVTALQDKVDIAVSNLTR